MLTKIKCIAFLLCLPFLLSAQYYQQYFDGYDSIQFFTNPLYTIIDSTNSTNIWQIGPPQKTIFNAPSTFPNVMVTDTINEYPINNRSSFSIKVDYAPFSSNILALQWMQKLDMEHDGDGGIIEYSTDTGATWVNVFNNPYTYNFYGYDNINKDTLNTGDYAFSGQDSVWKNIWLCFDNNFLFALNGDFYIRFTFLSDSIDTQQEGWMIDNMFLQTTIIHTTKKTADEEQPYLKVFPTATTGRVNLQLEKLQEFHIIEKIELYSTDGRLVQHWGISPTKFYIDIGNHSNGLYYLKVTTNKKTETVPIVLNK